MNKLAFNENRIIKIIVELSGNGKKIDYYVDTTKSRECYTGKNVPVSIVRIMNQGKPIYHEKQFSGKELFVYRP